MTSKDKSILAIIPLDIYGHGGVRIMTEIEEKDMPPEGIDHLSPYKFNILGVTVSTRVIYISGTSDEATRQGFFHPICFKWVRKLYPSYRKLSSIPIGDLKDMLAKEGWAVNLPL